MTGTMLVGVLALLAVGAAGAWVVVRADGLASPPWVQALLRRGGAIGATLAEQLGRVGAFAATVLAGGGLMVLVLWVLGEAFQAIEPWVDHPVFRWFAAGRNATWDDIWLVLTNVGGLNQTQALTVVGAVVLAALWRRRRWWVPLLVLPVGYLMEKNIQQLLKLVVDRGHPPTTLGSYPSGGCARVIVVYGLIVFLALRWSETRNRRWWAAGAALVALLEVVQAYARLYNQEHWLTDVVGGFVFGLLLLATMVGSTLLLDRGGATSADPDHPASSEEVSRERRPSRTVGPRQ